MMNVRNYPVPFFVILAIVALLVASPALSRVLVFPRTEFFTEFYILGSNGMAQDYPYNISRVQNYSITLGLGNQLGFAAYYLVEVKFRNMSQSAPDIFNFTPSMQPSLFNITAFVADQATWELPLAFSFDYDFNRTLMEVDFRSLTLKSVPLNLGGYSTVWNSTRSVFYGDLIFEAWIYNASTQGFQYHQRYADLKLNMTVTL
jgi:hypothetical protein